MHGLMTVGAGGKACHWPLAILSVTMTSRVADIKLLATYTIKNLCSVIKYSRKILFDLAGIYDHHFCQSFQVEK